MLVAFMTSTDTKGVVPEDGEKVADTPVGRFEAESPTVLALPLTRPTETVVWTPLPGTTVPELGESTSLNA